MSAIRILLLVCTVSLLGGCAFGQKVDYRQVAPQLSAQSSTPVQVNVIDARPYVSSGSKKPTYVGTLRALYYNPFNITTLSGAPLARDISEAIENALRRASIKTIAAYGSADAPEQKRLVIRLNEWKSDTYMRTRFDYDITATVYDEDGQELASKRAQRSGKIEHVIHAGSAALTEVLNAPDIVTALAQPGHAALPLGAAQPQSALPQASQRYDDCMRRIARISDPALRLSSMSSCDAIK